MKSSRIKRRYCAALCLLLWLAIPAGAHSGNRLYPISCLSDEMVDQIQLHDASIDEWIELLGEPAMISLDFTHTMGGSPPDPSDLDFRIWLAWHEDPARIYVAFVASDDVYQNTHDHGGMIGDDSISLAIDGDHSGGEGCFNDCDLQQVHSETQYYEAIARAISGSTLDSPFLSDSDAFAWTALPPFGEGGGGVAGEVPFISVIELYVTPFDHLVVNDINGSVARDLSPGKVIGFAIMVNDSDEFGSWLPWTPEAMQRDESYAEAGILSLVDGILLSSVSTEQEDSAVESVSWGRIKAALDMK